MSGASSVACSASTDWSSTRSGLTRRRTAPSWRGTAQLPSPRIDADQGDHVYILLVNLGMVLAPVPQDPHTIHLHGMHVPTQLDGFPETSFAIPVGDKVT